ncbi:Ig-like domain-containing protein, partial [Umezakia ovalisporum]|uniref:Ig-like domain-containing protein n=1 Tax=Umezakia ovalisporum TaxID=75695 RepID=UPI0039C62C68
QEQTKAFKIIELNDKSIIIAGKKGIGGQDQNFVKIAQSIFIKNIDSCNNLNWQITIDSVYDYGDNFTIYTLEYINDLILLTYDKDGPPAWKRIECKVNASGTLLSSATIFSIIGGKFIPYAIKISENKNMYYEKDYFSDTIRVNLVDTNNILLNSYKSNLFKFSPILQEFKRIDRNKLSLILKCGYKDSAYKIINLDSNANFTDSVQIFFKDSFPKEMKFNQTNTALFGIGDVFAGLGKRQPYILKMDLNGNIVKKQNMPLAVVNDPKIVKIYENGMIFNYTKTTYVADTNLTILIKDSIGHRDINGGKSMFLEDVIVSSTNQLYQVGWLWGKAGTGIFSHSNEWLKKSPIYSYVKTISIIGNSIINTKGGILQLSTLISPNNAENKVVVWSINDTNIATISENGLVTAKADGKVIVSAQTTDGSNLIANKNITITNQSVGFGTNVSDPNLIVYPNPVSETLFVQCINAKKQRITLLNINGVKIIETENKEYNVKGITKGIYILQIEADLKTYYRKIIIE